MNMIPLFITLIIVIGIAVLGSRMMNKIPAKKRNYSYSKRIRAIFAGYLILLLFCFVLDIVWPHKNMADWKKVSTQEVERENQNLYNAAINGKINEVDHKYLETEWKFNYNEKTLMVNVQNGEYSNIQVIAERKKTNDGKIEATYYRSTTSMNDLDITDLVNPPGMRIADNQVTLLKPERKKIKISQFADVFSVNHFTGQTSFEQRSDFFAGGGFLYLKIPKDLQLVDQANLNIEYVK
jgi:hypothetical protein